MDLTGERSQKITPRHLRRQAYLYVRQSTLRQVVENTESTQRQYALRQRAVALGWPIEQVVVIDRHLGQSGASAADREGFQQLRDKETSTNKTSSRTARLGGPRH